MDEHALRVLEFDAVRRQLMEQTACSLGSERAEAMLPSDHLTHVQSLLDQTTECRTLIENKGSLPLGGITDIRLLIRKAEIGGALDPRELLDVFSTAAASRSLKAFIQKIGMDYPILAGLASGLGQFPSLESEINSSIGGNGQILDSASTELARLRGRKKTVSQRMLEKLNQVISGSMRTLLQDPIIVQRGDRYCVPVKADHRGAFGGIVHDVSASGATVFMEPQAVVDLGNELKELAIKESQEEAKVLQRLTESVRRIASPLSVSVDVLGEIDFISARAKLAAVHRAVAPSLNKNGEVRLITARHPLLDPDLVVPIDIQIGQPKNKILVITGPNTGGKTVSLKTVGLLTLMAQCGLHVPASHADMNLFYEVFADIGDEQSLHQSLSTFSGHVANIVKILRKLRPNSLILLDELGAGTDPGEGASLARAILEKLRQADARVIATSHYGELKTYALVTEGVQNASVEFDHKTLSPTYRLLQGVPGSSNAFAIAGRLGMPEDVLLEARSELTGSDDTVVILQELEENRRNAILEARDAERARVEAQMLRRRYQEELSNIESLRREARQKANEEARALLKRAQDKVDHIISDLRHVNSEGKQTERARQAIRNIGADLQTAIRQQTEEQPPEIQEVEIDRPLRKGDRVRVVTLGMVGEVLEDETPGNGALPIQVGAMRVSVPPSSLRILGGEQIPKPSATSSPARVTFAEASKPGHESGNLALLKTMSISPQINLLGQRAEEALQNVEKYLDDAYAAGLTQARIVHGKGTGALRRAVQDFLGSHPLVESFQTAGADEGGAGATVVTLRES